ncbi:uncharacterized protein LDX57_006455 [Aspergillus melleus]|uniref:uncharacterized protein n=1 Tax=Aspergillus melleus TaxID=138277 RepID=UPI001E8D2DD0|nr:uncharacterized protein LDX57_006455 [Aspergillus melleus]KAH8428773.1 hypothetical protein LDX57_006455 [Aspergillus melleus]
MSPEDEKAAKRVERLKQLQMEDLGSARREFISTSDIKKRENVSLQFLEAGRMSNVRGTEAQRQAEANKEQLSAWSNIYKGIGDTEDLENLDSLLSGQTHRFQLNAAIRGDNVQFYTQGVGKGKSASKLAPNPSTHAGKHTGVVASKNHQPFGTLASTGTSAGGKNREAFPKQITLARKPSVNILRNPSSENQKTRERFDSQNHSVNKGASGYKRPPPASLRTRRPAPEFVGDICSPASFLAASRSLLNLIPVETAYVASESASNDHSGEKAPSSTKQPPQKKLCTSSGLSESIQQPADERKPHQDLSSKLFEKYVLPGMTSPNHTIHGAHDSRASTSQKKPTTSLSDSIHKTNDVKPHPMQPSGLVLKHPTKEQATSLNRSVHSPKDGSAADYYTPFHSQAKHPQNGSPTSTVRSSGTFQDEKTTNQKSSQESAAKPPVKVRLPSSSDYTVHGPQDDKAYSTPISEPVINPEPNTTPIPPKAVQTAVPRAAPQVSSKGSIKPQREMCNAKSTQATQEILLDVNITPSKGSTQDGNGDDSLMSPSFQDLKGLDFAPPSQQVQTPEHEQSQPTPTRRLDFHVVSSTTKESEPVKSDDQKDIIEVLCQLMESASLSEKQKENLQQCKIELESKISNDPQTPTPIFSIKSCGRSVCSTI